MSSIIGLIPAFVLWASSATAAPVGSAFIATGDQTCPAAGAVYSASWTSPYAIPVYIWRSQQWIGIGGRLDAVGDLYAWVSDPRSPGLGLISELPFERYGPGEGDRLAPLQNHKAQGDPIRVDPGQMLSLYLGAVCWYPGTVANSWIRLYLYDTP